MTVVLLASGLAGIALYYLHLRSRGSPEASQLNLAPQSAQSSGAATSGAPRESNRGSSVEASAKQLAASGGSNQIEPQLSPIPAVTGPLLFGGPESIPVKIAAETVMENTRTAIRNYGSRFGGNPVGTNFEITQALNGENPGEVKFLDPENGMRLNAKGELVDPWGTPFFFHQLSANEMEIHCAGPDKTMWTSDDIVIK